MRPSLVTSVLGGWASFVNITVSQHSIANPTFRLFSRIYQKFVLLQGENLQIMECHPRNLGQPSCQNYRLDQNLRVQFLSCIVVTPMVELRYLVVGSKQSPVAHHLLRKNSGSSPILSDFAKLSTICTHQQQK